MHKFITEQFLPITIGEAWDFFSSPNNLALITPPEMDFKILSKVEEIGIFEGQQIEYTVKPLIGITIKWKTEIGKTSKHNFFTDKQLKGPYKVWEHTHTFLVQENGVLMKDEVNYKLPLGVLGKLLNKLFIKQKIENIFSYRRNTLDKIFVQNGKYN
jgi:ligand-binding SRPBCC domain-containing protein